MPQVSTNPGQTPSAGRPQPVPPEEQFWKRYSPHHEFSLSGAASVTLHLLILGLLVLLGVLVWNKLGAPDEPVRLDVLAVEEGPGGPGGGGLGDKKGEGDDKPLLEKVDRAARDGRERGAAGRAPVLKDPQELDPVLQPSMKDGRRTLAAGGVLRELNTIEGRAAYLSLQQGTSGAGGPGGKGPGGGGKDGTDRGGDGRGSGAAWARIRRARQDRWRIIFNTVSDGADYRDKLRALGAILVVAEYQRDAAGRVLRDRTGRALLQYRLVIRDVRSGARPQAEDVRRLRGIFWIDDKPESVASLARALGIAPPPPLFAAFFPEKVEQELRRLEKAKYAGPEADIRRTFFHVDLTRDGGYRLTCDRVLLKTE